MQADNTTIKNVTCPSCKNEITIGVGTYAPEILYALDPKDLVDMKAEFLQMVKDSTMTPEQKTSIDKLYGGKEVMIEPGVMRVMMDEIKKNYSVTNPKIIK